MNASADEAPVADEVEPELELEAPARPPLWKDPYALAGAAVVIVAVLWWANRPPTRQPARVVAFERRCRDCGKPRPGVAYVQPASADDEGDRVVTAVDPQKVVITEPADSGLDGAQVERTGDLAEPLDDVAVPVAPDERVGDLV